jgi:hypothetical protein
MLEVMKPKEDWGPANPQDRKAIYATEIQLTPSYYEIDKHFFFPDSERRLCQPAHHGSYPDVLIQGTASDSVAMMNNDHTVSTHSIPPAAPLDLQPAPAPVVISEPDSMSKRMKR